MGYAFDPDFAEVLPFLPTAMVDLSDPAAIAESRNGPGIGALMGEVPDRDDVRKEDLHVAGGEGDPEVRVRVTRPSRPPTNRGPPCSTSTAAGS